MQHIGLALLSKIGVIQIAGPDAKTFLQGQVTCDLNEITAKQSRLGAHCNLKGRMQSLFRLFQVDQNYYLSLPSSMVSATLQGFQKYALFSKVQLSDHTDHLLKIGIYGEALWQDLVQIASLPKDLLLTEDECYTYQSDQGFYTLCHIPGLIDRYELYGTPHLLEPLYTQLCEKHPKIPYQTWEFLDIQAGLPTIYPETVDVLLPHHVNLVELKGIGFKKGCYLGQEIIARMHYRGNIKKHMYRASSDSVFELPKPGTPVFIANVSATQSQGIIVRSCPSQKGHVMLVVIEDQYAKAETDAHLQSMEGPILTFTL